MATKAAIKSTKKSTATKSNVRTSAETIGQTGLAAYRSVCKAIKKAPIIGNLVAEFVGAFILTASFIEMQGNPLFVAFALVGVVLIVGGVSGANPAMTVAAWVTRKINWFQALGYIAVQLLGAATAYLVLNTFLKANDTSATQLMTGASPSLFQAAELVKGKEWYLFFAELLGTTILALGIATAVRRRGNKIFAGFAAGFAILIALYVAMSLTTVLLTASGVTLSFLNPAIAIIANGLNGLSWTNMWPLTIFVIAPILGGIAGFVLQDFLHYLNCDDCDCCK